MPTLDKYRIRLIFSEIRNAIQIGCVRLFEPFYRRIISADVAYMLVEHPIILPFMLNVRRHLGIPIHFLKPEADFSTYRKVIVPNGYWPSVRAASARLPENVKLYCEIGFLPQTKNVYFDPVGVHGYSSLRSAPLPPLSSEQRERLDSFKRYYNERDFVRVKWDSLDISAPGRTDDAPLYDHEFIFVPLQLESDTAFELCPFDDNQQIISFLQASFPDDILVFKMHPLDRNENYQVEAPNILLPKSNKNLRELIRQCSAVVASNSTVILEALLFHKKCATFGVGLSTNHHVTLECHDDLAKISTLKTWEPDWDIVDRFIVLLLETQISVDFYLDPSEKKRLADQFSKYGITRT